MPFLPDTDVLSWTLDDDARLGGRSRAAVTSGSDVVVSVATLWEVQVEVAVGKLAEPAGLSELVVQSAARRLAIEDAHLSAFAALPMSHRDPFDRMLIAQAQAEG